MILHQSEYNNEMSYHRYLSVPGIAISAHRGGSIEAPENTIEAFQYALDLGCEYIETDVQLSSDGIPYIFHDDDLKRLLNKEIQFNSLQSSEIDKLMLFQKYNIPTLEAALLKFPEALFQIDIKTDDFYHDPLWCIHCIGTASFLLYFRNSYIHLLPNIKTEKLIDWYCQGCKQD